MSQSKKHSEAEIASKLIKANDLATQGKLQSEIARTLGVSVMTLHRWREGAAGSLPPDEGRPTSSAKPIGHTAGATLPNSSSKIHGCDG